MSAQRSNRGKPGGPLLPSTCAGQSSVCAKLTCGSFRYFSEKQLRSPRGWSSHELDGPGPGRLILSQGDGGVLAREVGLGGRTKSG